MRASEFTLGLIRLTSARKAPWRLVFGGNGAPPLQATLILGNYRFVLNFFGGDGATPTLLERGNGKRPPTLIDAPGEVKALAEFVREWTRYGPRKRKAMPPVVLGRDDEVEDAWARLIASAERVRPAAEQAEAEREIFGKGQQ